MLRVLVVGQTPPPDHGQAIMIERLVEAEFEDLEIIHVRMAFSSTIAEIGRFRLSKLLHLISVVSRIVGVRVTKRPRIMYYPPAAGGLVPMLRDAAILIPTRWMFEQVVFHFHSSGLEALYGRLNRWQRWMFRLAYSGVDGAIITSNLAPADGKAVGARREYVIPNGIPDPGIRRITEPEFGARDGPLEILYVGILREEKGVLLLVDACKRLHDSGVDLVLSIVGEAESDHFAGVLTGRIADVGIGDRIRVLGSVTGPSKWALFGEADLLCHPTWYDTLPLVIIEAMAAGLPVVATSHSGIPSLVEDGVTGFLVAPRDLDGLVEALRHLAGSSELRARLGSAGRLRYEQEFSLSVHLSRVRSALLAIAADET